MRICIIDGYVDEPGTLSVPPYLGPTQRYLYGSLTLLFSEAYIDYVTIDQFRANPQEVVDLNFQMVFFISGVSVPGKYLGGTPIKFSELKRYTGLFPNIPKILCGSCTTYGIGEEGGKPAIPVEKIIPYFDLILYGDPEIAVREIFTQYDFTGFLHLFVEGNTEPLVKLGRKKRQSMEEIAPMAIKGAELIRLHPNFRKTDGGNLVCEIETFRGCPRWQSGGCSFCIEPSKGQTRHREPQSIISEVEALYNRGAKHFRLGGQTDFYGYQHLGFDNPRYPRPNPLAIRKILVGIRNKCPNLTTLHIDNVNALNFVLYPDEAREITQHIANYGTAGNIAAIGVESADPGVVEINNLKCTSEEILIAVRAINRFGREIGRNGLPKFLPGLNFIMGLPGENKVTLDLNYQLLKQIYDEGLLLRRINLRKFLVPEGVISVASMSSKKIMKNLQKRKSQYFHWKKKIRDEIDLPMLRQIFPQGTIIRGAYAEIYNGGTYLRQPGTYPITAYVPDELELKEFHDLIVIDHGFRSVVCLENPVVLHEMTHKQLESIRGIGKKRAITIQRTQPDTEEEWLKIIPRNTWQEIRNIFGFY